MKYANFYLMLLLLWYNGDSSKTLSNNLQIWCTLCIRPSNKRQSAHQICEHNSENQISIIIYQHHILTTAFQKIKECDVHNNEKKKTTK